jgi:hypothetical protein
MKVIESAGTALALPSRTIHLVSDSPRRVDGPSDT